MSLDVLLVQRLDVIDIFATKTISFSAKTGGNNGHS
jgi:hypothetical protein